MKLLACVTPLFALLTTIVDANTEKAIFLALPPQALPDWLPKSGLEALTRTRSSIRISLPVAFPTEEYPQGLEHWYLLRNLTAGQRHEVRVCWAAIQPTIFWLDVFTPNELLANSALVQNIVNLGEYGQAAVISQHTSTDSILALRIRAAADFFTSNQSLMLHPPPVDVDIILDPYIGNIFPSSLVPTAAYILILAICGWYISGGIWSFLKPSESEEKARID